MKWRVAVLGLLLALGSIGCTSEPWGCGMGAAACPAMADVQGSRYAVSGAVDLVAIEPHLAAFAQILQSNMSIAFADNTALAVEGVDPRVLLIVRNRVSDDEPAGFRELWSMADDPFPDAFCRYMAPARQAAEPRCDAVQTP